MTEPINPTGAQPVQGSGIAPLQRGPVTQEERDAQVESQKRLADRLTIGPDNRAKRTAELATNSLLTTGEHKGKGAEPDKDPAAEALKASHPNAGVTLRTVPISTHGSGKTTDEVVLHPHAPGAATPPVLHGSDAIGIGKVRAEAHAQENDGTEPTKAESVSPSTPTIAGPVQERETTPGIINKAADAAGPGDLGYVEPVRD